MRSRDVQLTNEGGVNDDESRKNFVENCFSSCSAHNIVRKVGGHFDGTVIDKLTRVSLYF